MSLLVELPWKTKIREVVDYSSASSPDGPDCSALVLLSPCRSPSFHFGCNKSVGLLHQPAREPPRGRTVTRACIRNENRRETPGDDSVCSVGGGGADRPGADDGHRLSAAGGSVSSLVVIPDTAAAPNAGRFGERLLRFYLGLEDPDDLIGDLQQAFRFRPM
jgi:hypothetical protein